MTAYLIVDELTVTDQEKIREYIIKAAATLKANGGELLASGVPEVLEGNWQPKRCVLVKFKNMENLKNWWNSEEYRALIPIRAAVSESNIITIDGLN